MKRELLNKTRKEMGISATQMANILGITRRYYLKIESGDRMGTPTLWDAIEDVIGINQRELRQLAHKL